jgi:cytochrome c oxidase subunit 2
MSGLIIIALIVLVFVIIYQIAKASEYATVLRGEAKVNRQTNRLMAWLLMVFLLLGMYGVWECHRILMDKMLPISASEQGVGYDMMLKVTVIVTGIVFFATQTLLFWFAFRYQSTEKRTSYFYAHNNKLELIWTTIPAIAMASLVAVGLKHWFAITAPAPPEAAVVEIIGKQFNWIVRYPGKDGTLGKRDFRKINDANNVLGLDWSDRNNLDDIVAQNGEIHMVVNKPVKLIIGSRDVIHNVGLPHFRIKMDAVPGITTTLWLTPTVTTAEMKRITNNPDFVYEISCAEMCGNGHYSMRGTIIVESQAEYNIWMAKQATYYAQVHGTPDDVAPEEEATATPPEQADTEASISMR